MLSLPHIGKRIIKSAIAVFLCLLVNEFRQGQGVVFYSCIAAVLCMQKDTASTIKTGRNRVIGTFNGGFFGLIGLLIEQAAGIDHWLFHAVLISVLIIPIIYTTVLLKQTSASYISCVVFMSITISHIHDANPYLFACNRILDTLIGIAIAYLVNRLHLPMIRSHHRFYLCDLTVFDLDHRHQERITFRRLQEQGVQFALHTPYPLACYSSLLDLFDTKQIILFYGSLLYDKKNDHYRTTAVLPDTVTDQLLKMLDEQQVTVFAYRVLEDILHVYVRGELQDAQSCHLWKALRKTPGHACIMDVSAKVKEVSAMTAYVPVEQIDIVKQMLDRIDGIQVYTITQEQYVYIVIIEKSCMLMDSFDYEDHQQLCVITRQLAQKQLFASADIVYVYTDPAKEVKQLISSYPYQKLSSLHHIRKKFWGINV